MSQGDTPAITDTDSAAAEIERRWAAHESSEAEDAEPDAVEPEQGEAEEVAEQEPETEPDEEQATYETIDQLAEALEMTPEEFMESIKISRKIDGVEESVTLAELRNGNQRDADYRRKTTELAEQRKAAQAEVEQNRQVFAQKLREVAAMQTNLENQMIGEYNAIDWNRLELTDREEWLIQRQKFGERQAQLAQFKEQTQQSYADQLRELQEQEQAELQSRLARENEMLLSKVPEWSDPLTRERENKQIIEFLADYGFSGDDVKSVSDHRLVMLIRDAFQSSGRTKQIDVAKAKVKTLPKILKPGAKTDKTVTKQTSELEARKRLKANGHSTDEIAKYLESRL